MNVLELISEVILVVDRATYGWGFYGTPVNFSECYRCSFNYCEDKPYGPFTLKEVNTLLWEFSELVDNFKASNNGCFQTLNLYEFRVNGFYFELDNGFYTHPSIEISSATSTEPYDLYKVVEMFGSEDDKAKFNDSGVLDDIGWDYYLPLGDS